MQNSDYKIFVLNELSREGNTDILVNPDPEVLKKYAPTGTFPMAINAFLVQKDNENILFDTGLGQKLVENLAAHNISPEQISKIFITHGHGDHIGGLLKDGKPIFPNAKLYINRVEYDYWMKEKNEPFTQVAETYKNNIQLFDIEKDTFDLMPDIQAIAAYGHTPGHTMYLIGKEKNQTLVWGDLTHAMLVQMPHPEISMTYDVNPEQAAKTRESVLKLVAEKEFKIAGMHVPLPGMGIIIKSKTEGYEFSPAR
jgi:glyoxylase-like metal-dependent hydrolase (beta-lactamase superfamily II)